MSFQQDFVDEMVRTASKMPAGSDRSKILKALSQPLQLRRDYGQEDEDDDEDVVGMADIDPSYARKQWPELPSGVKSACGGSCSCGGSCGGQCGGSCGKMVEEEF